MKNIHKSIAAVSLLSIAAVAVSQDFGEMPPIKPAEHQLAPVFDISTVDMAAWEATTVTGTEHEMLDQLVGEWNVVQKMFMPGVPEPMVNNMTAKSEWVLGGKHIKESLKGTFMGQPYEGMGLTSFDKYNGRYTFFWADSMNTATYISHGYASADGGTIETFGTMDEPAMNMRGKAVKYVLRAVNADTHVLEIHDLHIGGDNTMVMELTYSRKK